MSKMVLTPLEGIPMIRAGDNLVEMISKSLQICGLSLLEGDILVIAQKIISKAEGRTVNLTSVTPSAEAIDLAEETQKDPRLVELILNESTEVLRCRRGLIIVEHRLGFICANAGIDHSNVCGEGDEQSEYVLLLPHNPDASAEHLRKQLVDLYGKNIGVLIIDSHGRAWREGIVGISIGISGLPGLVDFRGVVDLFGYEMKVTQVAAAD
ncbi:MAG: coenzyme F420-0:L-glutamate ligase, partial [Anaerolineales bacterium]|nr:coenzyme F420-0:L-glutamate ligase [Anaerolineales bacterium]